MSAHPIFQQIFEGFGMAATKSDVAREARCQCGKTMPSSPDLAFFEARGPGSKIAAKTCRHCLYYDEAHKPEVMARNRSLSCTTFEAKSEGFDFDIYYCGCRGWD